MAKRLFHLQRNEPNTEGTYVSYVLVAESEGAARATAADHSQVNADMDKNPDHWLQKQYSKCRMIGHAFSRFELGTVIAAEYYHG